MVQVNWLIDLAAQILLSATTAAGLLAAGQIIARKVFDHWFDQRLEVLKSDHNKDLARLNHRLNSRISKIHDKEFQILSQAWLKINQTQGAIGKLCGMRQYIEVTQLSDQEVIELLKRLDLTVSQQERILDNHGSERQRAFQSAVDDRDLHEAIESQRLLQNHIIRYQIFLTDELQTLLSEINAELRSAAITCRLHGMESAALREIYDTTRGTDKKIPALGQAIRNRLDFPNA